MKELAVYRYYATDQDDIWALLYAQPWIYALVNGHIWSVVQCYETYYILNINDDGIRLLKLVKRFIVILKLVKRFIQEF